MVSKHTLNERETFPAKLSFPHNPQSDFPEAQEVSKKV